jgi:hypothetical protein
MGLIALIHRRWNAQKAKTINTAELVEEENIEFKE